MGTSEAYQDAEGNTLDDSLDSPSVQRTCVGGWSRVEVYYSGTWSGRAQGGVAKLEHLGNYPGVICQSVRVFHYICQPHKQVDKTAVIQWKKPTVYHPSKYQDNKIHIAYSKNKENKYCMRLLT